MYGDVIALANEVFDEEGLEVGGDLFGLQELGVDRNVIGLDDSVFGAENGIFWSGYSGFMSKFSIAFFIASNDALCIFILSITDGETTPKE